MFYFTNPLIVCSPLPCSHSRKPKRGSYRLIQKRSKTFISKKAVCLSQLQQLSVLISSLAPSTVLTIPGRMWPKKSFYVAASQSQFFRHDWWYVIHSWNCLCCVDYNFKLPYHICYVSGLKNLSITVCTSIC